jgi:putative inorganic carbon (HCO3(-)) transporter
MIGIESATSLSLLASTILQIEAAVIGLYVLFSIFTAWRIQFDASVIMPRLPFTRGFIFIALLALWGVFSVSLGFSQNLIALEIAMTLILSALHPALSIGFFLLFLFLRPWEIADDGSAIYKLLPRGLAFAAIISSVFYLVRARAMTFRFGPLVYLLFAFSLWTFLSTFKSPNPGEAQAIYFDLFFKSVILFLLITQAIRDEVGLRILKGALIFAAFGLSVIAIYRTLLLGAGSRLESFGLLADPNDISAVMVLVFPYAIYTIRRRDPSLFLRIVSGLLIFSSLVLFYYAKSRGAVVAMLVMIATMALIRMKNKKAAVIGGLIALMLFVPISSQFKRSDSDLSESTESRVIYWKTGVIMAIYSPVFGVGFNGYPANFERYAPKFIETGLRTAHSSWFLALAETGFIGFGLFLSLYIWALRAAWRFRELEPDIFFSTVGYGVAMSFLSHTYSIYFYIMLAMVFVASRLKKA